MTAQAVEPETLTLACQGTATFGSEEKPEPISMGIIVNFMKRTVHGFVDPFLGEQLVNITGITETSVSFGGGQEGPYSTTSVVGSLDRVTGDVRATYMSSDKKTGKTVTS